MTSLIAGGAADAKYVTIGKISPASVAPGETVEAKISFTVEKEFHVQANPAPKPYIQTELNVEENFGVKSGNAKYPAGKPYRLQGSNKDISVYDGTVDITLPLTAATEAKAGKYELKAHLKYQACNEKFCFFPTNAAISIPVVVTAK